MSADDQAIEYVGFWPRVGATVVDMVLSAVVLQPIGSAIYRRRDTLDLAAAVGDPSIASQALLEALLPHGPLDLLANWLLPAAAVILFWMARQATPGKMLIKARIVDADTLAKPTTGQWLIRYLGYYVGIVSLGLGFAWVGWDPRKQGWHDKMANTLVVRTPRRDAADERPGVASPKH